MTGSSKQTSLITASNTKIQVTFLGSTCSQT